MAECFPLHYHHLVHSKVLRYIRKQRLMGAGDRVGVAVSGGADSVALLRILLELRYELGLVLAVAHFNHQLRGAEADADEAFVAELAHQHDLPLFVARGDVRQHAVVRKLSVEAAARELRLAFFAEIAAQQSFQSIATAHTLDDQAETVLLKLIRGTGTRGLAGIYPELKQPVRLVRPLLCVTRVEIENHLTSLGQPWREDESNLDRRFTRNRVRHELLPLLEREYNPNIRQVLSDTADVARAEEECWSNWVERELAPRISEPGQLNLTGFRQLPLALRRRLLRRFAETQELKLDFEHVEKLRRCAEGELARADLPGGRLAQRKGQFLEITEALSPQPIAGYEYTLSIPGEARIAEIGLTLRAVTVPEATAKDEKVPGRLLEAASLAPFLTIRNWCAGDRFWPAHSASEQKLKRLFSEKHIPAERRPLWPVAFSGEEIVWVQDLPVAYSHAWKGAGDAVKIEVDPG